MQSILLWVLFVTNICLAGFSQEVFDYDLPPIIDNNNDNNNIQLRQSTSRRTTTKATNVKKKPVRNLNFSYFQALDSYAVHAIPAQETKYPWIARVIHSRTMNYPHVCTASCVDQRIFITAARCIANLKISTASIVYQKLRFPVKVFVIPSKPTKQLFDDIGFIVVFAGKYNQTWSTVKLFDGKRTDDHFQWFADLKISNKSMEHKAVGYATKKYVHKLKTAETEFQLVELNVIVDIHMCEDILAQAFNGYFVPCYHSCNRVEFKRRDSKCQKYLGVEGGAIINIKTGKLLGLATWGTSSQLYELPVGFSVPNSANFKLDFACARKIRDDKVSVSAKKGYFQALCPR